MNSLICPISIEKVNKNVVRTIGFLVALTVVLYALTGSIALLAVLLADFYIRAFTSMPYSPYSWLANRIVGIIAPKPISINKAPKLFASRVGFIFTLASVIFYFISPITSLIIALVLMSFALLESLFDFCVGCVVYTYIVLPLNKNK